MKRRGMVGRIIGWALLAAALVAVSAELFGWWRDGAYDAMASGELWAGLHANSLVGFGAIVEQRISPWLWFEVFVPLLSLPLWLVLGAPGALLAWNYRPRKRRPLFRKP